MSWQYTSCENVVTGKIVTYSGLYDGRVIKSSAQLLDDIDLDIVAALHISPRVPSAALGEVLGVPTSTVSRRLAVLQEERLIRVVGRYAWELITSSNPFELWIRSAPGHTRAVLSELRRIPDLQLIMHVSGPAELYANLFPLQNSDHEELLAVRIPSIPGVQAIDSRMILKSPKVGQSWRVSRLSHDQMEALEKHGVPADREPFSDLESLNATEFETMRALGSNGRISAAELARTLNVSPSTAARLIKTILRTGAITPRVEIQPSLVGYPLNAVLSLDVAPSAVQDTLATLTSHSSVRLLSLVTGTAPISVVGAFEGPGSLAKFVQDDVGSLPGVRSVASVAGLRLERRYWIDLEGDRLSEQVPGILQRAP